MGRLAEIGWSTTQRVKRVNVSSKQYKWRGVAYVTRKSALRVHVQYQNRTAAIDAYSFNYGKGTQYEEDPTGNGGWRYVCLNARRQVVLSVQLNNAEDPLGGLIESWLDLGLDAKKFHNTLKKHDRNSAFFEGILENPYRLVGEFLRFEDLDYFLKDECVSTDRCEGALLEIIWSAERDGHTYIYPWWRNL